MNIAWKRIESTEVHKVGWRTIVTKHFVAPDGKELVFDTIDVEGREFVAVVALTDDNKVIVARQFRPGPEKIFDELPGGFVDKGEELEEAMRREFMEETGYEAGQMQYLGGYHKDTYMNATWHIFFATGCKQKTDPNLGETEHVEVRLISIDELIANAKADNMTDQVGVLMAYDYLMLKRGLSK